MIRTALPATIVRKAGGDTHSDGLHHALASLRRNVSGPAAHRMWLRGATGARLAPFPQTPVPRRPAFGLTIWIQLAVMCSCLIRMQGTCDA